MDPEAGFLIINAGSSLLPPTKGEFSPVAIEAIALDRACTGCHQGLYYAEKVHFISDCIGILDMFIILVTYLIKDHRASWNVWDIIKIENM